ncbi:MAG: RcnB family protein [Pseudoxanthomonas sp.]
MNAKKSLAWLLAGAASLTLAAPVLAQDYPHDDDRSQDRDHRDDGRRADHRQGPSREWHRGDRYDGSRYVVDDYRRYDLPPPPDDHHRWVRDSNGDFVLIAITTGIITDLLLHHP